MNWDLKFLEALQRSRADWDEQPDWRAALALYDGLGPAEAAQLDDRILAMIDEDYRNRAAEHEERPFDDVMVNLPAGMSTEDLLCIEAAVMVAAERRLPEAFFRFNRLLRSPRWHPMYPRLYWLAQESFTAQRQLAESRAGRYLGAMMGLAAGDALGVTLEFKSREQIRRAYPDGHREILGGGPFGFGQGEWTDDTAMALAVARGIVEAPSDPVDAVGRHFMAWYEGNPPDVGSTCRMALEAFRRSGTWAAATATVARQLGERAGGNGALMRTIPTPLAYGQDTGKAIAIARMTHPHPESDAAVAVYHLAVDAALQGAAGKAEVVAAGMTAAGPLAKRLAGVQRLAEEQVKSTGYVVDTLEAALWAFLTTESLEECLVRAVNLGDDTDTVGAVAGGLAGAYYGVTAVPRRWSAAIREREQLEAAAEQLYQVRKLY